MLCYTVELCIFYCLLNTSWVSNLKNCWHHYQSWIYSINARIIVIIMSDVTSPLPPMSLWCLHWDLCLYSCFQWRILCHQNFANSQTICSHKRIRYSLFSMWIIRRYVGIHHCLLSGVPLSSIRGFVRYCGIYTEIFWNVAINCEYLSKYGGNFCAAVDSTGVISLRYQPPHSFLVCKRCHGYPQDTKNYFRGPSVDQRLGNTDPYSNS